MKVKFKVVKNRKSCMMPEGSMYCLTYNKGDIVKAVPGSFGVMVFENQYWALGFAGPNEKILKVRPIGRRKKQIALSQFNRSHPLQNTRTLKKFYKIYHDNKRKKCWWQNFLNPSNILYAPPGTECYAAVEVLE